MAWRPIGYPLGPTQRAAFVNEGGGLFLLGSEVDDCRGISNYL